MSREAARPGEFRKSFGFDAKVLGVYCIAQDQEEKIACSNEHNQFSAVRHDFFSKTNYYWHFFI